MSVESINVPPAPPAPFACNTATAFRALMAVEGLDGGVLPDNFSQRVFGHGDIVPPEVWRHFATKARPEQGQQVFNLITFIWSLYTERMTVFPPGNELIVAPPEMLGIDWLRDIVAELDYLCLPGLGLDGCRSINFRGEVTYPEVEEVRNRNRQHVVARYGLYNFDRLKQWVGRFDELYGPYQPGIANDLTDPKIIEAIASRIYRRNPDIFF